MKMFKGQKVTLRHESLVQSSCNPEAWHVRCVDRTVRHRVGIPEAQSRSQEVAGGGWWSTGRSTWSERQKTHSAHGFLKRDFILE